MRTHNGLGTQLQVFLAVALHDTDLSAPTSVFLPPVILMIGDWTGSTAGMGAIEISEISNSCRKLNPDSSFVQHLNLVTAPTNRSQKFTDVSTRSTSLNFC